MSGELVEDGSGVRLYWADVGPLSAREEAQIRQMMSAEEVRRCQRYRHEPSRRCCLVTRRLLRQTLSELGERRPAHWIFGTEEQGRPYLKNPTKKLEKMDFNLAHSQSRVVLAVAFGRRVGVDLESVHRRVDHDLVAEKFFDVREIQALEQLEDPRRRRRFLELWVLKEAWMKADGRGMGAGLRKVVFRFDEEGRPRLVALPDDEVDRWTVGLRKQGDHLLAIVHRRADGEEGVQMSR